MIKQRPEILLTAGDTSESFPIFYRLLPTPGNRSIRRKERTLRAMGLRLIKQRRASREQGLEKEDLLGLMLAAQDEKTNRGMTDEQLVSWHGGVASWIKFRKSGRDSFGL
jgi:cytochrome P450